MAVEHTIRTRDGGTKKVQLARFSAIKAFCTECMGWETHPNDCTSTLCALYPFRGKTQLAFHGENDDD